MGFDVYGENPSSSEGEYFRNNIWWWRPLWDYVAGLELVNSEQHRTGHYNKGMLIPENQAQAIARILKQEIKSGNTRRWEEYYKARLKTLPDETCIHCDGAGIRNDEFVQGTCNGCQGEGVVENHGKYYPFSTGNVEEFANFAAASGGFKIY